MSATYPLRKTAPARQAAAARPRLVVVTRPQRAVARGPFIALVGALMLGGLLVLLMLHTLAAQDAFQQTTLQHQLATLTDTEQQLQQQVQTDSAPAALEAKARALGMVPSVITSFHRRLDGRTVAHEQALVPVVAAPSTQPTTQPTTQPSAGSTAQSGAQPSGKPAASASSTSTKQGAASTKTHPRRGTSRR